jgi:hypothetical protein
MSALPPKADIAQRGSGVRYVPIADISGRSHLRSNHCRLPWHSHINEICLFCEQADLVAPD